MAKDPICGMFVEENDESIHYIKNGTNYYFCASQCLNEFLEPEKELKKLKIHLIISILLTTPIVVLSLPHMVPQMTHIYPMSMMTYLNSIILVLAIPVQFWIGWRFYKGLWDGIKAKASNMDTLIAVGTTAAFVYSAIATILPNYFPFSAVYFETSAIIVTLILVGRLLETKTKEKASNAIRKLLDLRPITARVLRPIFKSLENDQSDLEIAGAKSRSVSIGSEIGLVSKEYREFDIPIEQVHEGDVIIIKPGERIPTDGVILEGFSSIDESAITGESIPIDKTRGDAIFGATINKSGLIRVKATKVGQDTVLSQIISMVEDAKAGQAKLEKIVDQVSKYFVPAIILIATCVFLGWFFIGNAGLTHSILAFVSVMIIACPCALGLATPAALLMGSGRGAENGILYKRGEYIEIASKINTVVFDKTGTLTSGKPIVTDIISQGKLGETELLRLAAIAESGSEHPLARAIMEKAKAIGFKVESPETVTVISGYGLRAKYSKYDILIGNISLMEKNEILISSEIKNKMTKHEDEGKTVILIAINSEQLGMISISDSIKENAKKTISKLKNMGIESIMLTGDNERTAKTVSRQVGIERVFAHVLPSEKEEVVSRLKTMENKIVAMVGDGINDAPALARSDLGIAIGSGTDIAKETGGIILIKNDIKDVVTALEIGRKTVTKIKQNLFWAFIYNTGLIPIAAGALVPIFG